MKKYIFASLLAGVAFMGFTSCEDDNDSNPTVNEPTTFVLNTPAYVNSVYDLANSTSVELTCSQPDFGYTAGVTYSVEVALDQSFSKSIMLDTKYTTARMAVDASEMAVAFTNLLVESGKVEEEFPITTALNVRVTADLTASSNTIYSITSNPIQLPNVRTEFALPPVKLPTELYLVGAFCDWNWNNAPEMVPTYDGTTGTFWRMVYLPANCGLKFNQAKAWDGGEVGYAGCTVVDKVNAGVTASADGNIVMPTAGWYLVVIYSKISGRNIDYVVEFADPIVWMIGGCVTGGAWDEGLTDWIFTVPDTADDDFVSPPFAQDAPEGPRAYVKIGGYEPWNIGAYDWWKSEFMVFDRKLVYRGAGGDLDRVTSRAGQRLYINFTSGTGKIE